MFLRLPVWVGVSLAKGSCVLDFGMRILDLVKWRRNRTKIQNPIPINRDKIPNYFIGIFLFLFFISARPGEFFRFVVLSDTHNTLGNVKPAQVASSIKKTSPQFILHAGDFTCCARSQSPTPASRFKFDEFQYLGGIPVFPVTGNHDYEGNVPQEYNKFWNSRKPNMKINGQWGHSYSFDFKGFHFIAIDWQSNDDTWLKSDLKNNAGKPAIIFSHHAALKVGCKPGFNKGLSGVAETNRDVRAVFSGHSHCWGVYDIRPGAVQVFVGTVSHDNHRDPQFSGKHTFVVVDVEGKNLKICPASVEDGILAKWCKTASPAR